MENVFDKLVERRGSNSVKWDSRSELPDDIIPLWVADMDFEAAPPIVDALRKRVDKGVFGYAFVPDSYYNATIDWFERWHGWKFDREQMIYTTGVVPALSAIIKGLTQRGDKVIIQPPVYNLFFTSVRNNGCEVLENELILKDSSYEMDFDDFEHKASDPKCKLFVLCNPHNPAGRVWTKEELIKISDICQRHNVTVVSDEIHCELVFPEYEYTPFATVATCKWVASMSPSKAFNIAGLQIANIVCCDSEIRAKVDRAINDNEVCDVNPFGVDGLIAAYNECRPWLIQLIDYIHNNYNLLVEEFSEKLPQLPVIKLEGTYLAWVDCRALRMASKQIEDQLIDEAHVWVNAGSIYGKQGDGFIRINLATQRSRIKEALKRMIPALQKMLHSTQK